MVPAVLLSLPGDAAVNQERRESPAEGSSPSVLPPCAHRSVVPARTAVHRGDRMTWPRRLPGPRLWWLSAQRYRSPLPSRPMAADRARRPRGITRSSAARRSAPPSRSASTSWPLVDPSTGALRHVGVGDAGRAILRCESIAVRVRRIAFSAGTDFRGTVERWLAASGELVVLNRMACGAGRKDWFLIRALSSSTS